MDGIRCNMYRGVEVVTMGEVVTTIIVFVICAPIVLLIVLKLAVDVSSYAHYGKAIMTTGTVEKVLPGVEYEHISKYRVREWYEYSVCYYVKGVRCQQTTHLKHKNIQPGTTVSVRYTMQEDGTPLLEKRQY